MNNFDIEKELKKTKDIIKPDKSLLANTLAQMDFKTKQPNFFTMLKKILFNKKYAFGGATAALVLIITLFQFDEFTSKNDNIASKQEMALKESSFNVFQSKNSIPSGIESKEKMESISDESDATYEEAESQEMDMDTEANPEELNQTEAKIIKTGNLEAEVNDIKKAYSEIEEILKKHNGQIFSTNFYGGKTESAKIVVKVPVNNFEILMDELKGPTSKVIRETTNSKDVTEEYVDLTGRIKNKEAEEQAFTDLLGKAQKMEDILNITRELQRVRGEIERLKGRLQFLENKTSLSTITINLSEEVKISIDDNQWKIDEIFKKAVQSLIDNLKGFVTFLIFLVLVVIPTLLPYALVVLIAWLIVRKIKKFIKRKEN